MCLQYLLYVDDKRKKYVRIKRLKISTYACVFYVLNVCYYVCRKHVLDGLSAKMPDDKKFLTPLRVYVLEVFECSREKSITLYNRVDVKQKL